MILKKYLPLILAAFVLIVICGLFIIFGKDDSSTSNNPPPSDVTYTVIRGEPAPVTPDGISITPIMHASHYTYQGIKILYTSVNIPEIIASGFKTENINNILKAYGKSFTDISDSTKLSSEEHYDNSLKHGLEFSYSDKSADYVCYRHGNYLSVHFNVSQTAGATESSVTAKSFCFDLTKDKQITLSEFFEISEADCLSVVSNLFSEEISKNPERFDSDARERIQLEYDPHNFYLDKNGANAYFPPYSISPGAYGIPIVTIPYE